MRLSVNCMTRGPGERVAAQLALLRDAADEIVVAVDDRADEGVVDAIAAVADRVLLYPYREPVDRPLAWLHAQCAGEWVLTIDDDEVPSAALVAELPALVADDRITHCWLPRRWLWPDVRTFLDAPPWRPDYSLRLVRNDRRLLRFPPETHHPIAAIGPARFVDTPIYHLDCLLNPIEARERKARRYERLWPGKRAAGLPVNYAYYLPERRDAPTAPVPPIDVERIERALVARGIEPLRATEQRTVDAGEIDALWEGRELAEAAYRATLELREPLRAFAAGEVRTLDVLVGNRGDTSWPWGDALPAVRLVASWPDVPEAESLRTELPAELRPGESALVPVAVAAPRVPGRNVLELDVVHEDVRWFGATLRLEADVEAHPRVVIASGDRSDGVAAVERIAEAEPEVEPTLAAFDVPSVSRRTAAAVVPDARVYLLADLPRQRLPAAAVLGARAVKLARRALTRRRGRVAAPLPHEAHAFVEALANADRLVLTGDAPRTARERAARTVVVRVARLLGVEVVEAP